MTHKTIAKFFAALFFISSAANGQAKTSVDIYSQYVWRGGLFCGEAFQPALTYSLGNFSVGAWGSYSAGSTAYQETDLSASYAAGPLSIIITDYFIPVFVSGTNKYFFDYNSAKGSGSHVVELGASYTGPESFPLSLAGYYNIIGGSPDPDNSSYIQVSYPFRVEGTTLTAILGATPAKSTSWYATQKAGIINLGIGASKTIKITEDFSLPFNVQYILNPTAEKTYLVFGVSL